jgi:hypothetical protein
MESESNLSIVNEFAVQNESKDFYNYIVRLNLVKDLSEILVLPSRKHFFYAEDEISQFKGIVNINKLNYISKLNEFMYVINILIKKDTYFFGCFVNNKYLSYPRFKETNHSLSKFIHSIKLLIDSKMKRLMSENDVKRIFEAHGFKVENMKEIRGVTYFSAKRK